MSYPSPAGKKKITNNIIEWMNALVEKEERPTDFVQRKIAREIEKLKAVDRPDYYDLLGMLAAISNDLVKSRRMHESAIRSSGNSPYYRHHLAISLNQFCLHKESLRILRDIIDTDNSDHDALDSYISTLVHSGNFEQAAEWIDRWNSTCPKEQRPETPLVQEEMVPYMSKVGLADSDVSALFERAFQAAHDLSIVISGVTIRWPEPDKNGWPAIIFGVSEPVERVADLIDHYCDLEAENGDPAIATKVMASFDPIAA